MEHVAIMRKSWGLTKKILSKQKKIESRWYKTKRAPWDRIKSGETVYFKDSGELVAIKAEVEKVIQFSKLTPEKVKEILYDYSRDLGIDKAQSHFERVKDKRYCILIFLKNPQKVEPFEINKSGFGLMSAWISVKNIKVIKW